MPKQPHPADVRNAEIIARAVRYELALFLGRGAYAKASVSAFDEIPAAAARLVLEYQNGRRPLIYAIDAAGRSALIEYRLPEATEEPMQKTYAKRFNAQRAAKAAGYVLADIEIVKTAGGFSWRPKAKAAKAATAKAASKQGERPRMTPGRFAEIEAAAREGVLPDPPDFSAATHTRFRGKLAKIVALAKAGDIDGLKTIEINPVSSSPKAMARYRDLCVIALLARARK
jgi:hypothetical protein